MGGRVDQLADGEASGLVAGLTSTDGAVELSGDVIGARLSVEPLEPLEPLEPQAATAIVATSARIGTCVAGGYHMAAPG